MSGEFGFKPTFGATEGAGSWVEGPYGFETAMVHAGVVPDPESGAILTPVMQSTTFVQPSVEGYLSKGFSYSRTRNPTVESVAEKVAALEGGAGAYMFSTGMAATCTLFSALLKSGDHCVITECSYGGTNRAARVLFKERFNIDFTFCDFTKIENIEKAIQPNTKLIFSESPANPVLTLTDVAAVSELAKKHGILHACDSTFATPVIMCPLQLGADFVCSSSTKYIDGHNMTVGGVIVYKDKEQGDKIGLMQNIYGNIMAPWTGFLQGQACKTIALRIRKQSESAQVIAEMLEAHPKVEKVMYPGLKSFPQKELADRQHKDGLHGGMLWFEVKGGVESGIKIMNTCQRPWSLCENLGATESIITCPAVMTHANMLKEDREKLGITDGFIRVSVGIEDVNDLVRALKKSLDAL
eukprot:TRINITY_DN28838_c0_g1_i1.p1 TRINITY_DN28838_c0_g1~~TRINITY_DN28838_c0_g1_i1.p1  ORF type:complete len:412 (+),score=167.10 TRINITY_DN28838_c0_g1_i1:128-1363(+)